MYSRRRSTQRDVSLIKYGRENLPRTPSTASAVKTGRWRPSTGGEPLVTFRPALTGINEGRTPSIGFTVKTGMAATNQY
jgi:hypothetical protein